MTSTGEFRKRIDKNLGFPVDNKKIKTEFKIYLELLTGIKPLQKALNKIKLLPNPYFSDYEWKILRSTLQHRKETFVACEWAIAELKRTTL